MDNQPAPLEASTPASEQLVKIHRHFSQQMAVGVPLILLLLGLCCFAVDIPVQRFLHQIDFPGFWKEVVQNTETFGHGIGVFFILMAVLVLDRGPSYRIGWLAIAVYGAGLITNLIKLIIARTRPRDLDVFSVDVNETFQGLFPMLQGEYRSQSFPSGHTTTAFALAMGLSILYPKGRIYFFILAMLVGWGRMQTAAHYPSDILCGAALGWTFAYFIMKYHAQPLTGQNLIRALKFWKTPDHLA